MEMVQWNRDRLVMLAEAGVILFLGFWMLEEYAHNVYLQDYVASFWVVNWWVAPAAAAALVVVGGISYYVGGGSGLNHVMPERKSAGEVRVALAQKELETNSGVMVMDVCPFCNSQLRMVGEDRFHCRKCKRYFKR